MVAAVPVRQTGVTRCGRALGFLVSSVLLGVLLSGMVGCARPTPVTAIDVAARVAPDGSMEATETRTVAMPEAGTVTWRFRITSGAVITVHGLSDEQGDYAQTEAAGQPRTFRVVDEVTHLMIEAQVPASPQPQSLTLRYAVGGAAKRWYDTAEFSWEFIGDTAELPTTKVRARVTLPGEVPVQDVRAWANGPLYSEAVVEQDGTVLFSADDLPAETVVEGRILFPRDALSGRMVSPWKRVHDVLKYETDTTSQIAVRRALDRAGYWLSWVLAILVPLGALGYTLGYRYKRRDEFRAPFSGERYTALPSDLAPAQVSALMHGGSPDARAAAVALGDLIDRGALRLEPLAEGGAGLALSRVPGAHGELERADARLVCGLFDELMAAERFTLAEMRARLETPEGARVWGGILEEYGEKVHGELVMRRLYEHRVTRAGTWSIRLAMLVVAQGLVSTWKTESAVPLLLGLLAGLGIERLAQGMRTVVQPAADLVAKYQGLQRYLGAPGGASVLHTGATVRARFLALAALWGSAGELVDAWRGEAPEALADPAVHTWVRLVTAGADGVSPLEALTAAMQQHQSGD